MKVRPVNFNSDNVASASPEILAALVAAKYGAVASYGDDTITSRLEARFRGLFERDVAVFPVVTGTAANALCLAACVPPWGVTYCHRAAYIACDECGAPEFYSGGGKLALLDGALAAEAVVVFDAALATTIGYRRKRAGHLFSKMRFLSAQLDAYLADDLWLRNAEHANRMATRIAAGPAAPGNRGIALIHPVEANELFVRLPETVRHGLAEDGFLFHGWGAPPAGPDDVVVRLVTAWNTEQADVDNLVARAAHHAETGPGAPGSARSGPTPGVIG